MRSARRGLRVVPAVLALAAAVLGGSAAVLTGLCGPFTDVSADAFCPFVLEIFTLGITTGTTATTYDPASNVSRLQMAAFLSRTVDNVLKRGGRRAALGQFATPQGPSVLAQTTVDFNPIFLKFDGADIWVSGGSVDRVRASDGKLLGTWTSATQLDGGIVIALGLVVTPGFTNPGRLNVIDPTAPPGAVTLVASNVGVLPSGIAFDGARFWTANDGPPSSVSIITPGPTIPWTVTTVTAGFQSLNPEGALFDGSNIWVTGSGSIKKLDSSGNVLQTVFVGSFPRYPIFDGVNIWVPNSTDNSVSVVRASTGVVLQTLTGNGLIQPVAAAYDGERILVSNPPGDSVSLWKAADLTPIGTFSTGTGTNPWAACSDGVNFWIPFNALSEIARF